MATAETKAVDWHPLYIMISPIVDGVRRITTCMIIDLIGGEAPAR